MNQKEKKQAEKKADIALCKIEDIFYLNPNDAVVARISKACDAIRELILFIENAQTN